MQSGANPPEVECVTDGESSSGCVDKGSGCPLTIESGEAMVDYESESMVRRYLYRIAGVGLVLVGIVVAIAALMVPGRGKSGGSGPPQTPGGATSAT